MAAAQQAATATVTGVVDGDTVITRAADGTESLFGFGMDTPSP